MTTYSKQDLRTRVLRDATVLDIARPASATDAENVDPVIQQCLEELETENVVIFNSQLGESEDCIPGKVFLPLADFVRSQGMGSYGVAYDQALRDAALMRLRRATLDGSDDTPSTACFY